MLRKSGPAGNDAGASVGETADDADIGTTVDGSDTGMAVGGGAVGTTIEIGETMMERL